MSIFDNVAFPKRKRNLFNLSHEVSFDARFGALIPFLNEEVLPGDTWQVTVDNLVRTMPMLAPLMHRVNIYTHFFFVPYRLIWDDWKDFITGGEDGTANPLMPYMPMVQSDFTPGSLADCLGVGSTSQSQVDSRFVHVSALPFRAYSLIWNEYYRDQNLQEEIEIPKISGLDQSTNRNILLRNWEKDYFTSALPWTQRGPISKLPIEGTEDVYLKASLDSQQTLVGRGLTIGQGNQSLFVDNQAEFGTTNALAVNSPNNPTGNDGVEGTVNLDPNGTMAVDFSSSVDINELRRAIALQRFLEANARGGSRYIEQLYSHFGVVSSDARLQRPQYLGGGLQPVSISEVIQTSSSTATSDLGDMAGHGISASSTKQFRAYFEEHGLIIGICSILPKPGYSQGTKRFFGKKNRFDFAFPEFANLGEQAVWNSEIYQGSTIGEASGTFGYQSRYAEYKYLPNRVFGNLKTDAFSAWTLNRIFGQKPLLNEDFIEVDTINDELGRIFPDTQNATQFICQFYLNIKALRKLPKFVIPDI